VGLKLRLNLFHDQDAPDVFGALAAFYGKRGASLVEERDRQRRYDLYGRKGHWCVLDWDGGWEWKQRREAQLFVSTQLRAAGLLIFVYDGDYWGYELFRNGEVLSRFVQYPPGDGEQNWFPDDSCVGDAEAIVSSFPELSVADIKPYLVQRPFYGDENESFQTLNEHARPGDEFRRFDECAVLDFLRAIGLGVELRDGHVRILSDIWRSFRPEFGK
jgi:hypothetical protein